MRNWKSCLLAPLVAFLLFSLATPNLQAQSFQVGGQAGAVGANSSSDIGFGAFIVANPYGIAGMKFDANFSDSLITFGPAVVFYPVDFEEMRLGLLGGAGFYKISGAGDTSVSEFGVNFGVGGDFALSEGFALGMETRYHSIFDTEDAWMVFLTAAFQFELEGAW